MSWNISPNPTINDNITNDGQGADAFTSSLTGLSPGTKYYYRAYATNGIGTGYGEEFSFQTVAIPSPDIITNDATNITLTSAICSGSATSDTINAIQSKGICYSLTSNPSINDLITDEGAGSGSFSSLITGLLPDTTYFIRAYAITEYGTYYGNELSFQTLPIPLPDIVTNGVTNITPTSAICSGSATSDTINAIQSKGICYSLTPSPSISDLITDEGAGSGSFSSLITGLLPDTTYFIRAYAITEYGTYYGNEKSFTTPSFGIPVVKTIEVSSITYTSAVSGGEVTDTGYSNILDKGVCWNTSPNPTITDNLTNDGQGADAFVSALTGLSPGTTYYYRAYATNGIGTGYGEELSFQTTPIPPPDIITNDAANITAISAICSGSATSDTINPIQTKGICYSFTANPSVSDLITDEGSGSGSFSSLITGLLPSITYFFRAYAITEYGTYYGNELSFQTPPVTPPDIITNDATNITSTSAICSGSASSDTINTILAKGICYSLTANPSISDLTTFGGSGSGSFSSLITGLLPGTTYFIRAYAITAYDTYYGNEKSFTTNDTLPEVETVEISVIKALCAIAAGVVITDGGDPVTSRGFCWSKSPGPTMSDQITTCGAGTGDFTGALNYLDPSTTYYVRSFATNSVGTVYGSELTFTTEDPADWILVFSDDFESYTTGTHPSANWVTRFDGEDAEISEDVAYEGNKSFMLSSKPLWARVEAIPLDSVPDLMIYEGAVYISQADKGYAIGFGFKESSNTYRSRSAVDFSNNGKIDFGGELQNWTLQTWYKIKVECNFSTLKGKIWIDDLLMGTDIDISDKTQIKDFALMGLNFSSGLSKAYFDNIKIFVKSIDPPTCD